MAANTICAERMNRGAEEVVRRICATVLLFGATFLAVTTNSARANGVGTIYVTHSSGNVVTVLSATENAVLSSIEVGSNPRAIVYSGDGRNAYVSNRGSNSISVIEAPLDGVVKTYPVGSPPEQIFLEPNNRYLYVVNSAGSSVFVVDVATGARVGTLTTPSQPGGITLAPGTGQLLVTLPVENALAVIDTGGKLSSSIKVGKNPVSVAAAPNSRLAYVSNLESDDVTVIDLSRNEVVATVPVGKAPRRIALSPDAKTLYAANEGSNTISIIATDSNKVKTSLAVGKAPNSLAVSPDGKLVYVVNGADATVAVIDAEQERVKIAINVEPDPNGIAVSPLIANKLPGGLPSTVGGPAPDSSEVQPVVAPLPARPATLPKTGDGSATTPPWLFMGGAALLFGVIGRLVSRRR